MGDRRYAPWVTFTPGITDCDLKSSNSFAVSWKAKSAGNLAGVRQTACSRARLDAIELRQVRVEHHRRSAHQG